MEKYEEVISFGWQGRRYSISKKSSWIVLPNGQILTASHWNDQDDQNKMVALKLEYTIDLSENNLPMVAMGLGGVLAEELADLVEIFGGENGPKP